MHGLAYESDEDRRGVLRRQRLDPLVLRHQGPRGSCRGGGGEYIRDNFNLYGLRQLIQYYPHALEMILSNEAPDEDDLADGEFLEIYRDATVLYGLIHARFIVSPRGLQVMREKYLQGVFGTCPRVYCERQHVLPIGTSEDVRVSQVKMFCPLCEQVYSPMSKFKELDGAYFGTSFPQVFLQTYASLVPLEPPRSFVARVHGFKMHRQKSLIARRLREQAASSQSAGTRPADKLKDAQQSQDLITAELRRAPLAPASCRWSERAAGAFLPRGGILRESVPAKGVGGWQKRRRRGVEVGAGHASPSGPALPAARPGPLFTVCGLGPPPDKLAGRRGGLLPPHPSLRYLASLLSSPLLHLQPLARGHQG
ncbi:unnamed protein product [Prorocentrum cordatum]|uniref:Casein kinase II subunit beta n=1 Tax=Prorocentrum cordatum TaxID=2364126 RepID=A0ABN9QUC9_9DINO|nr:unnamed protein product [Polarella glacialis]